MDLAPQYRIHLQPRYEPSGANDYKDTELPIFLFH